MRRCALALVLSSGCGPLVAVSDEVGGGSGSQGDDEGEGDDDGPGPGPAPTSSPTSATSEGDDGPIDDEGEGDVDEGWDPDVDTGLPCSEDALDACFFDSVLEIGTDVHLVVVHDVLGDEWPDLVVVSEYAVTVHPGEGGSWSDPLETPTPFASPHAVAFGDVLANGEVDLVAIQAPSQAVWVAAGDGAGHFQLPTPIDLPGVPLHLEVADLDDDGLVEPIVALADGRIAIVRSTHVDAPELEMIESGVWDVDAFEVRSLGIGGPGQDLLVSGTAGDQILLQVARYEDAVNGQWLTRSFVASSVGLAVRDFNGDTAIDVATASGTEPFAALYHGYGDGTLLEPNVVELPAPSSFAAGGRFTPELDGIVTAIDGTPTIVDFSAGTATPLSGPLVREPLAVADYNGDGISDIIAPTADGHSVAMYWSQP